MKEFKPPKTMPTLSKPKHRINDRADYRSGMTSHSYAFIFSDDINQWIKGKRVVPSEQAREYARERKRAQ